MLILMIPVEKKNKLAASYWEGIYHYLWTSDIKEAFLDDIMGGTTNKLEDYYYAYK